MITWQQYGSAAVVRTVVKDKGVQQQWGRWYSQAPVRGRYCRNKKKEFIAHRTQKDSYVQNGPPTHHGRRSAPTKLYYIQQNSSAAVRTAQQNSSAAGRTSEQPCSSTHSSIAMQQYLEQCT